MLILLSPAKDLDLTYVPPAPEHTTPDLLEQSERLVAKLRGLSAKKLGELLGVSPRIAAVEHARYQAWQLPFTADDSKPAALLFNGEAYRSLKFGTLDADDQRFAQRHLRLISGLYGVLRPFDRIMPYRLMMGTRVGVGRGVNDLYAYWGDRPTRILQAALDELGSDQVLDLSSAEYGKVVRWGDAPVRVLKPAFMDRDKTGKPRVVMVYAKQQRGAMARWCIRHRVLDIAAVKDYKEGGYAFDPELSAAGTCTFVR